MTWVVSLMVVLVILIVLSTLHYICTRIDIELLAVLLGITMFMGAIGLATFCVHWILFGL